MKLAELQAQLAQHGPAPATYAVPPRWMGSIPGGYVGPRTAERGIIHLDPYAFYAQALAAVVAQATPGLDYTQPLARLQGEQDASWLSRATVYGALV